MSSRLRTSGLAAESGEPDVRQVLFVALGGAVGALARWGVGYLAKSWFGERLPWGTAIVNVLGALLFGLVFAATEARLVPSPLLRLALLTGFLGAFTTFSTFMFDTAALLNQGRALAALLQLVGQLVVGFAAMLAGLWLGRLLGVGGVGSS